jgi:uncharacterized protein (TIGR00297 family)
VKKSRLSRSETLRKLIHIGFGLFAFSLRWLTTTEAAVVAIAAFLFNWLLFPHFGSKRISRSIHGYDAGMLLYPLAVLVLIVAFPRQPAIAGVAWIVLAFGDGGATLAGRIGAGPRLPWNRDKSLLGMAGFVVFAFPMALLIGGFLEAQSGLFTLAALIAIVVAVAAVVETLPLGVNDNVTVPAAAALTMLFVSRFEQFPAAAEGQSLAFWLTLNVVLAIAGYLARAVNLSGMAGGALLGAAIVVWGGWPLYAALLLFFAVGSGATKLGFAAKAARRLAQEEGGRRGFSHAAANGGVATVAALLMAAEAYDPAILWIVVVAALATAAADTTASEIGQLFGRRTYLPLTLRRVEPGIEGAVSLEGTAAGAVAALIVAAGAVAARAAAGGGAFDIRLVAIIAAAAVLGSYAESLVGSANRTRREPLPNGMLNFANTLFGALIAAALVALIGMPAAS